MDWIIMKENGCSKVDDNDIRWQGLKIFKFAEGKILILCCDMIDTANQRLCHENIPERFFLLSHLIIIENDASVSILATVDLKTKDIAFLIFDMLSCL